MAVWPSRDEVLTLHEHSSAGGVVWTMKSCAENGSFIALSRRVRVLFCNSEKDGNSSKREHEYAKRVTHKRKPKSVKV